MTRKGVIAPVAPRLPSSPNPPDAQYIDQLNNVLRLYFNQVDGALNALIPPYGAFSSYVTQSVASSGTATKLLFATTDFQNGVTALSSDIKVNKVGLYNLQFSVQVSSNATTTENVYIWLRKNGTNIDGSTGRIGLPPRKAALDPAHDIKGWNYFIRMDTVTDYVDIYWTVDNAADVTIPFYAASGTPPNTRPSTASVVVTMTFVSALPA